MDIAVIGAGAVGGTIGGRLTLAGHRVGLIARGPHLDALRSRGLLLESPGVSVNIPVRAASRVEQLDFTPEIAIVATKTQDFATAISDLDPDIPVACATNGVEAERVALRRRDVVLGILVGMPAQHLQPGVVQVFCEPYGVLDVGCWPSGESELTRRLSEVLSAAGFSSRSRSDISAWKYSKLLTNLGNALQAAAGTEAMDEDLLSAAREEALAVYRAAGISSVPLSALRERMEVLQSGDVAGAVRGGGSTWQSLARRSGRTEADYLSGEIALLGRLYGVPTPVNTRLQRIVEEMARTGAPPGAARSRLFGG